MNINSFVSNRLREYAYVTDARKFACKWRNMEHDYNNRAADFVMIRDFLKAYINGEMRHQFKSRGKCYYFEDLPQQCKNNLKSIYVNYASFLSLPH